MKKHAQMKMVDFLSNPPVTHCTDKNNNIIIITFFLKRKWTFYYWVTIFVTLNLLHFSCWRCWFIFMFVLWHREIDPLLRHQSISIISKTCWVSNVLKKKECFPTACQKQLNWLRWEQEIESVFTWHQRLGSSKSDRLSLSLRQTHYRKSCRVTDVRIIKLW